MAREKGSKPGRSETLTIRLDPKTRFALEFAARLKGQTITTTVERAVLDYADRTKVDGEFDGENWLNYWDVSDGVRFLNMAGDPRTRPTYEEEYIYDFCRRHWPFFWTSNSDNAILRKHYVEIIWPRIDEFLKMWSETKSTNHFAAGKAMAEAIRSAGVAAPDWPQAKPTPKPSAPDLDDEIPF